MKDIIYKINLNNNKYYIGKTTNYNHRMDNHICGDGAHWVKKHGFVNSEIIGEFLSTGPWEETKATLNLMIQFGINNVRGAEYCQLADFTIDDCKRISYAAIHHIPNLDQYNIEQKLKSKFNKVDLENKSNKTDLKTSLYNLRSTISRKENCKLYNIFKNETLDEITVKLPKNIEELKKIKGVGDINSFKYGNIFLEEIKKH